jgi:AcrR family transcriptional regulator
VTTAATRRYRGLTADERKADRRARLLAAGLERYGTAGYAGASVERICATAGLSTRQFYDEFGNRDELLVALYDDVNDRAGAAVAAAIEAATADGADLRRLLDRGLAAYVATTAADPRWAQVAYVTIVGVNAEIEAHREARRAAWADLLAGLAADLADRGLVPARDYRLTMRAFIGAVNELVQDWCRTEPRPPMGEVTGTLAHLLHSAVTAPPDPAPAGSPAGDDHG